MMCRETLSLLPLFFDGELDPRQMRAVAMHSTRCSSCEAELRELERLQELVSDAISARVEEIDLNEFWPSIERRLGAPPVAWWERVRTWWSEGEHRWVIGVPAFGAAIAAAVLAFLFFARVPQPATPDLAAPQLAAVDNAASIDSLESDLDSVAVLNDPETRTTVLWVSDDSTVGEVP